MSRHLYRKQYDVYANDYEKKQYFDRRQYYDDYDTKLLKYVRLFSFATYEILDQPQCRSSLFGCHPHPHINLYDILIANDALVPEWFIKMYELPPGYDTKVHVIPDRQHTFFC